MKRLNFAVPVAFLVSMLLCSCRPKNDPPAAAKPRENVKTNQIAKPKTNAVAQGGESASEAALIKAIKLQGIGGTETRPFAIINGRTLEAGEAGRVKAAKTNVLLRCVAISNASVVVTIEGLKGERKLYLN